MRARVLPREEWHRIPEESGIKNALQCVPQGDAEVIVVEEDGEIIASWAVLRVTHLEGAWIAPERRGNLAVARRLLVDTFKAARKFSTFALTGSNTDHVAEILSRLGAERMPMDTYKLAVGR